MTWSYTLYFHLMVTYYGSDVFFVVGSAHLICSLEAENSHGYFSASFSCYLQMKPVSGRVMVKPFLKARVKVLVIE